MKNVFEMTRNEYLKSKKDALTVEQKTKWNLPEYSRIVNIVIEQWEEEHLKEIKRAIKCNYFVPDETLADYPELQIYRKKR